MTITLRTGQFESPLRFRFRHASANRAATENVIVEARDESGLAGYGEGCPRDYVTGETAATAKSFIAAHGREIADHSVTLDELRGWIDDHESQIDANPSAFAAIELAVLDLMGKRTATPLEVTIGTAPLSAPAVYTAVVGDSSPGKTRLMGTAYALWGFSDFKVKLSGDAVRDRRRFSNLPQRALLRADANNYWRSAPDCISHVQSLGRPLWAIEEPVAVGDSNAMRSIATALDMKIVLDESLVRREQLEGFAADPRLWVANIRVSKCGGVLRAVQLARHAQAAGLDVILGAHVGETSLLTRAALAVGQSLSKPPAAREGAYGKILLRNDLATPSLGFARGGQLNPLRYGLHKAPGLGLAVVPERINWST